MKTARKTKGNRTRGKVKTKKIGKASTHQKGRLPGTEKTEKTERMDDDFNATFLENLQKKQEELRAFLDHLKSSRMEYNGQLNAGDFIDEIDDAQREISSHQVYSLIERKQKELRNIERLVTRIRKEEEEFGICEECGTSIPNERLLIVPETTLCVSCQRELERLDSRVNSSTGSSFGIEGEDGLDWDESDEIGGDDSIFMEFPTEDDPFSNDPDTPPSQSAHKNKNER